VDRRRSPVAALAKADHLADAAELLGRIDAEYARVERALQNLT
jgi:hypothetical protein